MKLKEFGASSKTNKRFRAVFQTSEGRTRTTHFGQRNTDGSFPQTFLDGASPAKRKAFLARHKSDLQTKDPLRAGFLSYFIVWGPSRKVETNLKAYLKRFHILDAR